MSDRHPLQPIFKVSTHKDLIAALVARRRSLGLTQIDVDAIGGLAGGHTAKIECGTKKVGYVSLALLLGALKLELLAVPASGATKPLQAASPKSTIDPDNYVADTQTRIIFSWSALAKALAFSMRDRRRSSAARTAAREVARGGRTGERPARSRLRKLSARPSARPHSQRRRPSAPQRCGDKMVLTGKHRPDAVEPMRTS